MKLYSRTEIMSGSAPNPLEEDTPLTRPSPEGGNNPFLEDEDMEKREPLGLDAKRRGTLEKIANLSPFWKGGKNLLGGKVTVEKRRGRRQSEDVNMLSLGRKKDGGGEEDGGALGGGVKRLSFLWLGGGGVSGGSRSRRESMVEGVPENTEVVREAEKTKEPLSVLEILHLIQRRELRSADQHIIELEAECDGGASPGVVPTSPGRQAKDVTLLYEALMKEMWAMVEESLSSKGTQTKLDEVIEVIQQEEDRKGPPGNKDMRCRWVEAVRRSVDQRLKGNLEGKMGSLPSQAERVKRTAIEDLTKVKNHLVCAYPREFDVFRTYLCAYHQGIAEWLNSTTQRNLETNEIYFILDWNSNVYCRDVLSRPEISPLINQAELGALLRPRTQMMLEEQCVSSVKLRVSQRLEEELNMEQECWKLKSQNEDTPPAFSGRVIQIMKPHVDRAPGISGGFGVIMSRACLSCFTNFLHSLLKAVERFHSEQDRVKETPETYICRVIGIMNCCPPFREFATRMALLDPEQGAEPQRDAERCLDRTIGLGTQGICDLLLQDLKPFSRKFLGRRWLSNSDACDGMVSTLTERVCSLRKLSPGPYQAVVSELHRRVLLELVRPLVQGKMVCTASKTRKKVASKLKDEARQLEQIFSRLESPQTSLNLVVPHLAEILVLEDTATIQMEVGMLVSEFPDFRKRHLSAILDVRGLYDPGPRHAILGVLYDLESADAATITRGSRGFFSDILITRDTRCINVCLSWASQMGRRTWSRLSHRDGLRSHPGPGEEDTQL